MQPIIFLLPLRRHRDVYVWPFSFPVRPLPFVTRPLPLALPHPPTFNFHAFPARAHKGRREDERAPSACHSVRENALLPERVAMATKGTLWTVRRRLDWLVS